MPIFLDHSQTVKCLFFACFTVDLNALLQHLQPSVRDHPSMNGPTDISGPPITGGPNSSHMEELDNYDVEEDDLSHWLKSLVGTAWVYIRLDESLTLKTRTHWLQASASVLI